jgi:cytochrome c-type biogenesis protein CcmE
MSDGAPGLDLSPRTGPDDGPVPRRPRSRGRGLLVGGVIVLLMVAIVALLISQVSGSSLYYYNVDEALDQRDSLGDRDIRIQGTVVGEPTERGDDALVFDLAFGGESVAVRHIGSEPPPLFGPDVPSVLEGHFADDGAFVSERIVIKHSEEYREDNPEHVEDSPT